ncbi:MAG TPA: hypothetical protein GX715_01900 [Armatimonadetes bacterium]|nr:hypothetical protein [Armatimonadota bacterium]
MDAALAWVVLGVSLAGLSFAVLVPGFWLPLPGTAAEDGDAERATTRLLLVTGAAVALVLFLATLPAHAPWSSGQALGRGYLLGAAGALMAVALLHHLRARVVMASREPAPAALQLTAICGAVGLLSLGVLPLALAVLLFPASIIDALLGVALGGVLTALLARLGYAFHAQTAPEIPDGATLQGWAVYLATLAGALAFGFYHFPPPQALARIVPLGLGAAMILAVAAAAGLFGAARTPARAFVCTGVLSALVLALLSAVMLPRWVPESGAVAVVLLGIGTAFLSTLLAATLPPGKAGMGESAGIAGLMLLGLYVTAFDWLRGYGVGLALVGAWVAGSGGLAALYWRGLARASALRWQRPAPEGGSEPASVALFLHQLLAVGLLALLFRLFLERYRPLATDLSLTVHFTFVGLVVGALIPLWIAESLERSVARLRRVSAAPAAQRRGAASAAGLFAAAGIAFWAVGAPAAVGIAWGMRSLVGLLAGLLVAGVFLLFPRGERGKGIGAQASLLATVLIALATVQLAHLLEPLGVLHREVRVTVLGVFAVLAVLSMLLGQWSARGACKAAFRLEGEGEGTDGR